MNEIVVEKRDKYKICECLGIFYDQHFLILKDFFRVSKGSVSMSIMHYCNWIFSILFDSILIDYNQMNSGIKAIQTISKWATNFDSFLPWHKNILAYSFLHLLAYIRDILSYYRNELWTFVIILDNDYVNNSKCFNTLLYHRHIHCINHEMCVQEILIISLQWLKVMKWGTIQFI